VAAKEFVLAIIDVDDLRSVNERDGNLAGDALLTRLARLLRNSVGGRDIAARIGGDEFVPGLRGGSVSELIHELGDVRRRFSELSDGLTLSAGIVDSEALSYSRTPKALIRAADVALRAARHQGSEQLVIYRSDMEFVRPDGDN
jgi:diguanylate cyclase (GGDEF)-like protein